MTLPKIHEYLSFRVRVVENNDTSDRAFAFVGISVWPRLILGCQSISVY